MAFVHHLPDWPRFTWRDQALAAALAHVRHEQGRHLGRMEALGFELQAEAGLEVLTTETVKSWAIEGETLASDEVRSSIASRLGLPAAGLPRASRQIDGIVELMLDASLANEQALTEERLFGWHAALFPTGRSGLTRITTGVWRQGTAGPMRVVSGPVGKERLHFEAPNAERVPAEMGAFLEWFNEPHEVDPVLWAGVAHLWFLTIHPFEDGNGRIARAIGDMALARADRTKNRFYSLSAQIEAERKQYYLELEAAQSGNLDITGWLSWFLACLDRAITRADDVLGAVLKKAWIWSRANLGSVNDRQRLVLNRLLDDFQGHLTTSKYAKLAKCSQDSAQRDIRELIERGVLAKNPGGGRSTSYSLLEPHE